MSEPAFPEPQETQAELDLNPQEIEDIDDLADELFDALHDHTNK